MIRRYVFIGWEPEGRSRCSVMFRGEPEGRFHHRLYTVIAPFWFSTEYLWTTWTSFWPSTNVFMILLMSKYESFWCSGFQWMSLWRSDKFLLTLSVFKGCRFNPIKPKGGTICSPLLQFLSVCLQIWWLFLESYCKSFDSIINIFSASPLSRQP